MSVRLFDVSVVLLSLSALVYNVSCLDCVKQTTCSCRMDDGTGIVDLTSLGFTNNTARFQDVPTVFGTPTKLYSYNPCGAFTEGQCQDAAVCMQDPKRTSQITIGNAKRSVFEYQEGEARVVYFAGTGIPSASMVRLICDPNACDPEFQAIGSTGCNAVYERDVTSVQFQAVHGGYEDDYSVRMPWWMYSFRSSKLSVEVTTDTCYMRPCIIMLIDCVNFLPH